MTRLQKYALMKVRENELACCALINLLTVQEFEIVKRIEFLKKGGL